MAMSGRRTFVPRVALGEVDLVLAGCGNDAVETDATPADTANPTESAAEAECEPAVTAYGPDAVLLAAFASDGKYRVLCWLDAPISKSPPPGPDGEIRPSFDRAVVGIRADNGAVELIKAGYRDSLRVEAP
jgi:hypothetical protein